MLIRLLGMGTDLIISREEEEGRTFRRKRLTNHDRCSEIAGVAFCCHSASSKHLVLDVSCSCTYAERCTVLLLLAGTVARLDSVLGSEGADLYT